MNIIIFSKNNCSYCEKAKFLCKSNNLEFTEKNINENDKNMIQFKKLCPNARTMPQIIVDDELIGGYDNFFAFLNNNG